MKPDEIASTYLLRAQEYSNALANISEPVKEKDHVMLVISSLREEYNELKSTIMARQAPTSFQEINGLLDDHDFMVKKKYTCGYTCTGLRYHLFHLLCSYNYTS